MLKITHFPRVIILVIGLLFGTTLQAQIGIGTTAPAGGSILDITSADKGILVPRVNIADLTTIAPVTGGATVGLLVWNTRAATGVGYHYWSGSAWVPLVPATATTNDWSILGNNNITNGTNYLGTTNLRNLDFRTNNALGMRIFGDIAARRGLITVNSAANPFAGDQFTVYGTYAVNGYTNSATGIGVYGQATSGYAVAGDATTGSAVIGFATSGEGVYGDATTGTGVTGLATTGLGVYGFASNANGISVAGEATNVNAYPGFFVHNNANGHGLLVGGGNQGTTTYAGTGIGISGTGRLAGILGRSTVVGDSNGILAVGNGGLTTFTVPGGSGLAATATNTGIYGYGSDVFSTGVYGDGGDLGVLGIGFAGVWGETYDFANGYGVISNGDFLAAGVKNFQIDHPLDPANKYLKHASIESNEILNLYRGSEVFDGSGKAVVTMPEYYDAINKNASYQLTPIGAAMPNLYIEKEVENGRFIIAGGIPGKKVSWQLTAERNDPYLQQYPNKRNMELDKGADRGKYLIPGLYGKSKEYSIYRNHKISTDPALRAAKSEAIPNELTEEKVDLPEIKKKEAIKKEATEDSSDIKE